MAYSSIKGGAGASRPARALTHKLLESLRPEATPYRVPDARTKGLAARVAMDGRVSWDCSFRISGTKKTRRVSLGAWPSDADLEQARDRANELTRAARAGRDLLSEETERQRTKAERATVGAMIDEYVQRQVRGRLRTAVEIERRLKRALASVLDRPAGDIRRRDIRALLDVVADRGARREAEKPRQTIGAMWKWAVAADIVESNATAGLPTYDAGTPRERVLTPDEIVTFWQWLPESKMPAAHVDTLRLCLLIGARCGEVAGMQAEEIDREHRLWTLPGSRNKNGQIRVTPLVGQAWEIVSRHLEARERGFLFTSENESTLTAAHVGNLLLNRDVPIAKFVTHDLRRTAASGMVDLGISMETVAAVLGHAVGGNGVATLRRHYVHTDRIEPKRHALEAWSQRVEGLVTGTAPASAVVPFNVARTLPPGTVAA